MRKILPLHQIIEDAKNQGIEASTLLVDPDDVLEIDPNDLDEEENTDSAYE